MRNFVMTMVLAGWAITLCPAGAHAELPEARGISASVRHWIAHHSPVATAAQAREYGFILPPTVDSARPLVVLVHGLDMDQTDWDAVTTLLKSAGQQVGWFNYPQDQPIADDVKLLVDRSALLWRQYPNLKMDLVAYSMGGLVCRGYVEGPAYAGGVDRLILLSTPNHGSTWAEFGLAAKCREQFDQMVHDPHWAPSWIVTSGLCEADCDLLPGSTFLTDLNAKPRRAGVRYTIVEGDEHVVRRISADWVAAPSRWVPKIAAQWPGVRQIRTELAIASVAIAAPSDRSDGPVKLNSANLTGVTDIVKVHADHATMIQPHNNQPPAAWETIKARLAE